MSQLKTWRNTFFLIHLIPFLFELVCILLHKLLTERLGVAELAAFEHRDSNHHPRDELRTPPAAPSPPRPHPQPPRAAGAPVLTEPAAAAGGVRFQLGREPGDALRKGQVRQVAARLLWRQCLGHHAAHNELSLECGE